MCLRLWHTLTETNTQLKDYYKILEVPFDADLTQIKKAYRKLALQYHPDRNKSAKATSLFIDIVESYEVLSDSKRKAEYDTYYKEYFFEESISEDFQDNYETQQETWSKHSHQKAREYSSMKYDDFEKRIIREVKLGVSYIPQFLIVAVCFFICFVNLFVIVPTMAENGHSDSIGLILSGVAFWMGIGIYAYYKVSGNYKTDREKIK